MRTMYSCSWSLGVLYFVVILKSSHSQFDRCRTPDGKEAHCVDIYRCQPILDLLKSLRPPHPPAVSKKLGAYKCGGGRKVCCPSEPIIIDEPTLYHMREVPPDVKNHKNFRLLPTDCGYLDDGVKIVGGDDAALNEFPWMALLQYKTSHGLEFLCGGTIINPHYILTAAHCLGLQDTKLVSVRVGEYSIKNSTDCEVQNNVEKSLKCNPPVQNLKIEEIISHPQFMVTTKTILNDIALLRVSKISKAQNVYPVCLPVGEVRDWPFENVFVTGWGLTNSQTQQKADILQKVGLPIVDQRTCEAIYSDRSIGITKTQICAGGVDGQASCSGDSGGPILAPALIDGNFIYVQHGIVSLGPDFCGIPRYPGIYTMVKYYMDWVLDNMKP